MLKSPNWIDRRDISFAFKLWISNNKEFDNPDDYKKMVSIISRLLNDSNSKVVQHILDILPDFTRCYSGKLGGGIAPLVANLLRERQAGASKIVLTSGILKARYETALLALVENIDYSLHINMLLKLAAETNINFKSVNSRLLLCQQMLKVLSKMALSLKQGEDRKINLSNDNTIKIGVTAIIHWSEDQKMVELRKAADRLIYNLQFVYQDMFDKIMNSFERSKQLAAARALDRYNKRTVSSSRVGSRLGSRLGSRQVSRQASRQTSRRNSPERRPSGQNLSNVQRTSSAMISATSKISPRKQQSITSSSQISGSHLDVRAESPLLDIAKSKSHEPTPLYLRDKTVCENNNSSTTNDISNVTPTRQNMSQQENPDARDEDKLDTDNETSDSNRLENIQVKVVEIPATPQEEQNLNETPPLEKELANLKLQDQENINPEMVKSPLADNKRSNAICASISSIKTRSVVQKVQILRQFESSIQLDPDFFRNHSEKTIQAIHDICCVFDSRSNPDGVRSAGLCSLKVALQHVRRLKSDDGLPILRHLVKGILQQTTECQILKF